MEIEIKVRVMLLKTRFLKARPGQKLRQHGKLGKLEIISNLYLRRFVTLLTLKILSMSSNLVYEEFSKKRLEKSSEVFKFSELSEFLSGTES